MLQIGDTVGPRYTAPKISAIRYLFGTFSLFIMGATERPRYTGFRGLSVRGITALQCNYSNFFIKTYFVTHHQNRLIETALMRGHNICFC